MGFRPHGRASISIDMTTVGHSLAGLAIAALVVPRGWSVRAKVAGFTAFALLANLPDAPLPGWGHSRYLISHSLFVALAAVAVPVAALAALRRPRAWLGGWPVVLGGAGAWLSHLLLDTFYNHGRGLRMFWPASRTAALKLPVPWFSVLRGGWAADVYSLRIATIELLCYGGLLAACVLARRRFGVRWR